jgi:GNAT superfamily N-acetyltransferase
MVHTAILTDGHVISDDRNRIDMEMVLVALSGTYWASHRPRAQLARSWANCLPFGVYAPGGEQVGFGRLLTDFTFRAHLGDVFIHPASRGRGLGRALIETVLSHPELATVEQWTLVTADAHALYARYGFEQGNADPQWMTLDRSRTERR